MDKCIFCEIIRGKIPAAIIAENEGALCFLDVNPIAKGHCLIIPKKHFSDAFDIPEKDLNEVMQLAKKVAKTMKTKLGAEGVNILHASGKAAQQSVFHFHIHLVPRYEKDGLNTWPKSKYKEKSLDAVKKSLLL
ncbi:MAG: HIT family protein [Candidatus Nanoarchaeia archaeon]